MSTDLSAIRSNVSRPTCIDWSVYSNQRALALLLEIADAASAYREVLRKGAGDLAAERKLYRLLDEAKL